MALLITFFFYTSLFFSSVVSYKKQFLNRNQKGKLPFVDEELVINIKNAKKQKSYSGCYPLTVAEYDLETKAELLNQLEINYEKQQLLRTLEAENLNNKYEMGWNMKHAMKQLIILSRLTSDNHPYTRCLESGGLYNDFYDTDF
jgi:hypothetical protein